MRKLSLERKITVSAVLVSSVITAVMTIISIAFDYDSEVQQQKITANQIKGSISEPLGVLLYNGDESLIAVYAKSVLSNREISCIEIEDFFASARTKKWCDSDIGIVKTFEVKFPIYYNGDRSDGVAQSEVSPPLGNVRVQFSDRYIVEGIRARILTFLATQAFKTFVVSLLLLTIIRSLAMRHIRTIFNYFKNYESGKALTLRGRYIAPEFDSLTESINQLIGQQEKTLAIAEEREHSYNQLAKVFYPHQLDQMRQGSGLESTMPVGSGHAAILAFDLVGSSRFQGPVFKVFLRKLISKCNEAMLAGYSAETLRSTAYRIKVMGDGFLCAVGYPFSTPDGQRMEEVAVELAQTFVTITSQLSNDLGFDNEIFCAVGIAKGQIETFFPDSNPSEYDLFGTPLIHATRYESSRRPLFEELGVSGPIVILQKSVYDGLPPTLQKQYQAYSLNNWKIRDDAEADKLYYRIWEKDHVLELQKSS